MKTILLMGLLALNANGFAGEKGNGGDVVVCFGSRDIKITEKVKADLKNGIYPYTPEIITFIESVRLLDFYEYGNEAELVNGPGDFKAILNERFDTIHRLSFSYGLELKRRYEKLQFDSYRSLPQVYDEKILPNLPENCLIAQVAIQNSASWVVLIDSVLFNMMDETNKAGLILHESLYSLAIQFNQTDSYFTRRVNNKVFNQNFGENTAAQIFDLFSRSNMETFKYERFTSEFEGVAPPKQINAEYKGALVNPFRLIDNLILPRGTSYTRNEKENIFFITVSTATSFKHGEKQIDLPANTQLHISINDGLIVINRFVFPAPITYAQYSIKEVYKLHENGAFAEVLFDQDYKGFNFFIPKARRTLLNPDSTLQDGTIVHLDVTFTEYWYEYNTTGINASGGYNLCRNAKFDKDQKLTECLISTNQEYYKTCIGQSCLYLKRISMDTRKEMLVHSLASSMFVKLKENKWHVSFDGMTGIFILNAGEELTRWNWKSNHCQTGEIEFDGTYFICR